MSFLSRGKKRFYQPNIITGLWAHNLLRTQRREAIRPTCILLRSPQPTAYGQNSKRNDHVSEPYLYKSGLVTEWAKRNNKKTGARRGQEGQPESLWFSLKLGWAGPELHGYSSRLRPLETSRLHLPGPSTASETSLGGSECLKA